MVVQFTVLYKEKIMVKTILKIFALAVVGLTLCLIVFKTPLSNQNNPAPKNGASNEEAWRNIWYSSIVNTELDKLAKQKLTELGYFEKREIQKHTQHLWAIEHAKSAKTTEEWRDVWLNATVGSDIDHLAAQKLTELGHFAQQEKARLSRHQEAENKVASAKTEEDWRNIWLVSLPNTELDRLAKEKLTNLAYFKKTEIKREIEHKKAEIRAIDLSI
jgi:hypothetical protein